MSDRKPHLPAEVRRAADQGDLITAIRILRTTHRMHLATAKAMVEDYLRQGPRPGVPVGSSSMPADAVAFLHEGNLIGAIRRLREATGLGLKESKTAVEQYLKANPLIHEQFREAARRHRRGPWRALLGFVLAVAAVLVAMRLLRGG